MDQSIFMDKSVMPNNSDLIDALGNTIHLWQNIVAYTHEEYPSAIDDWNFSGVKYGWSFRVKDKKRAIIYFLPRDGYFKVAFVFGQKATDKIMMSSISEEIKTELAAAKVYAEGRGIRISVVDEGILSDIRSLIDIKLAN
jgi:hypothetical protein